MINKITIVFFLLISCISKNNVKENVEEVFSIVIHGGAGTMSRNTMTEEIKKQYIDKLDEAVSAGYRILKNGGSSQEAVEKTIIIMEDSPLFNAGKGAVLNYEGNVELDASFMNGKSLNAGAISGSSSIKNPISAAISVMKNSPHVMLSGAGADEFANNQKLVLQPNSYFIINRRLNSLKSAKSKENPSNNLEQKIGTVGCVALDKYGNISAGTSTGGMTNKRWNRIGDVPIIGSGTYANNKTCGVSTTGWGEFFIRSVAAYDISALMEYKGLTVSEASKIVIHEKIAKLGGNGGVIALDVKGNVAMEMNTEGMYRAHMDSRGNKKIKIFRED
ncbi:MAG: beta-aspartyl-peptidase [Flavobacteriaceae bacterium]|nr:beta-aspartyl-peptidase [Flavobacteriaceae bacterium]